MVALLDLGIPLSLGGRVALKRPQCEVAVCFSPRGVFEERSSTSWCGTLWVHPADLL